MSTPEEAARRTLIMQLRAKADEIAEQVGNDPCWREVSLMRQAANEIEDLSRPVGGDVQEARYVFAARKVHQIMVRLMGESPETALAAIQDDGELHRAIHDCLEGRCAQAWIDEQLSTERKNLARVLQDILPLIDTKSISDGGFTKYNSACATISALSLPARPDERETAASRLPPDADKDARIAGLEAMLCDAQAEVERLRKVLEKLGSSRTFTIPFALDTSFAAQELKVRISFARRALSQPTGEKG